MGNKVGDFLGGVRSLADLKLRCYVDAETGCWHLRTGHGRRLNAGDRQRVHVHRVGTMTAGRAAYYLQHGKMPPEGHVVWHAHCSSHDCVRPGHLSCDPRAVSTAAFHRELPAPLAQARAERCRRNGRRQAKVCAEVRSWIVESAQTTEAIAHATGLAKSRVIRIKADARARPSSVFVFRG